MAQNIRKHCRAAAFLLLGVSIVMDGFDAVYHTISIILLLCTTAALFFGFKMNKIVSLLFSAAIPAVCFMPLRDIRIWPLQISQRAYSF